MENPPQTVTGRRPGKRFSPPAPLLQGLYAALRTAYGEQPWWPADSPFEVMVGAVLTQNAAWTNVEKAIAQLKAMRLLDPDAVLAIEESALAAAIRPAGYFNVKARRLRNLCAFLSTQGGVRPFARRDAAVQRAALLGVNGIGPETADDILLYALDRPVFVIDTYTRRLMQRFALADGRESYEELRHGFERALGSDLYLYQQFHALIVIHAKQACRKTPRCASCEIHAICPTGSA